MAGESVNRRRDMSAEAVAEEDYESFCEALGSSARGRAFLKEYARRNRHADTEAVLAALRRVEEAAIRQTSVVSPDADRIRQDLRALLDTLRTARPQTENSPTAIKAATLAALIDFTQARIEALTGMADGVREVEALAAVPALEQPELPIPHPAAPAGPVVALVHEPPRAAERPNIAAVTSAVVEPLTRMRELTGVPFVEFDYRTQQAARPVQPMTPADEAWTALAMPAVATPPAPAEAAAPVAATPVAAAPVEVARAPEPMVIAPAPIAQPPIAAPEIQEPESKQPDSKEPETYELWLDEPVVAGEAMTPLSSLDIVADVTPPAFVPAIIAAAAPETPAQSAPPVTATMTAIEALVQQMEKSAPVAAPTIGRIDVADPLAPIMALSEEERIALFT